MSAGINFAKADDLAFPNDKLFLEHSGLTKREYFAAMAMQGYLASWSAIDGVAKPEFVAEKSVEFADALIKQLNENG